MQNSTTSKQIIIEANIRPLRFAFIVNRQINYDELREVYQYNTSLWGGFYNLFVPADGKTIRNDWWRILINHDPDIIFLVGNFEELNLFIADLYEKIQPFLKIAIWDSNYLQRIISNEPDYINPLGVNVVLENLYSDMRQLEKEGSNIRYPNIQGDFYVYLEFLYGSWSEKSKYMEYVEKFLGGNQLNFNISSFEEYLICFDEMSNWLTPLKLSQQYLRESFNSFGFSPPTLIISNGLLDDLFLHHALRWALRDSCVTIPIDYLKSDEDFYLLANWLNKKIKGNTFNIVSFSIELEVLKSIREKIRLRLQPSQNVPERKWHIDIRRCNIDLGIPNIDKNKTHDEKVLAQIDDDKTYYFEIPEIPLVHKIDRRYKNKQWVCEIDLSPHFGSRSGFMPSMFRDLNLILSGDSFSFNNWGARRRFSRGNLAFIVNVDAKFNIMTLPSNKVVIETACRNMGYEIVTNKTPYYQGIIDLLDGLDNLDFLRSPDILELMSNSETLQGNGLALKTMYNKLKIGDRRGEFQKQIQYLAGKQILLRGYNLECPNCGLVTWYEMARVEEHTRCDGCRITFTIPVEIDFAYRLNTLFMDKNNQGTNAVLLMLILLYKLSVNSLIWQADVKLKNASDEQIELDIIAMCDGFLIIGECKNSFMPSNGALDKKNEAINNLKEQLSRDIACAISMNAHVFFFATLEKNMPVEIEHFITDEATKNQDKLLIQLISREELLKGYIIFDKSKPDTKKQYINIARLAQKYILPKSYLGDDCYDNDDSGANWHYVF